jgi:vacuolar-type H+-ATPase subunit H
LDRQQKIAELRKRYEDSISSGDEEEDQEVKHAQGDLPENVHKYFQSERERLSPSQSKLNLNNEKSVEVE